MWTIVFSKDEYVWCAQVCIFYSTMLFLRCDWCSSHSDVGVWGCLCTPTLNLNKLSQLPQSIKCSRSDTTWHLRDAHIRRSGSTWLSLRKFIGGIHVGIKFTCRGPGTLELRFPANSPNQWSNMRLNDNSSPQCLILWLRSLLSNLLIHRNQER